MECRIDISQEMFAWLEDSKDLRDWASSYLLKKELKAPGSTGRNARTNILEWARQLPSTPETTRLLDDMKQAWAMRERRRNNTDKISCSFELSTEAKAQLDHLSAREGKTKTAMLEQLIKQAADKAKKDEVKSEKKRPHQRASTNHIDTSNMTIGDLERPLQREPTGMTVGEFRRGFLGHD
ncbi:ribbon-helix-helix protein, CopG family [Pseudomonas sp. NPDC077649]|uniref:ribbon-helix-helix protein, CopG family n=1 Tax=Pseudomonas sp. NPDC077649 TaxID=3364423 RepID=UPI0037C57C9A